MLCDLAAFALRQRSAINGDEGYVYTVVFEDSTTNVGDQPMLTPSDTFTGTASTRVRTPSLSYMRCLAIYPCCGVTRHIIRPLLQFGIPSTALDDSRRANYSTISRKLKLPTSAHYATLPDSNAFSILVSNTYHQRISGVGIAINQRGPNLYVPYKTRPF